MATRSTCIEVDSERGLCLLCTLEGTVEQINPDPDTIDPTGIGSAVTTVPSETFWAQAWER